MKKLLVLTFAFSSLVVFGQLQKGNLLIGSSLFGYSSKSKNTGAMEYFSDSFQLDVNASAGLFLTDRSVLGLGVGYGTFKNDYGNVGYSTTENKSSTFSIAPYYRYYFPMGDKVAFYLHASAGASFGKGKQAYNSVDPDTGNVSIMNSESDNSSQSVFLRPGIAFFISPKWSVEATVSNLGYQHTRQKNDSGTSNSNNVSFNYNAFGLGLSWYLSK